MAEKKYVSARDGEKNTVIYVTSDGEEYLHSGGTRAWRNNNPGNIIASEKSGLSIGKGGRFAVFASREDGFSALKYLLKRFYSDLKLNEAFKKYAPSTDHNDPEHYAGLVKKMTGLDSSRTVGSLNDEELKKFMVAIGRVEGWKEGKIDPIPHAQQFLLKGVDGKPLSGVSYFISYLLSSGEEKKITGKTDEHGKTDVALTDCRAPVQLHLPRPDPGQSLKSGGAKAKQKASEPKQVLAAEVTAKPWYSFAFTQAAHTEEPKHDGPQAQAQAQAHHSPGPGAHAGAEKSKASTAQAAAAKSPAAQASAPHPPAPHPPASSAPTPRPPAPIATVKQAGAVQASGTKKKADDHVEQVVKDAGLYVTWVFDTTHGSKDKLNNLPYFIAEMSGNEAKPLVAGQRIGLLLKQKIRQKVPFGKEVAIFLGNDAKPQCRRKPMYRVKAEEGLTDIIVEISEKKGLDYDAELENPSHEKVDGTKKTYKANLFGTTWMNFSHKFTEAEAADACKSEAHEVQDAVRKIYAGSPHVGPTTISLTVPKPNGQPMKILWVASAFGNCRTNIPAITSLLAAKDELIPRVHPNTYKSFLKAAFELDAEELEIASGWRPMLGSPAHRIGLGLDVARLKVAGHDRPFHRAATSQENSYNALMGEKGKLEAKKEKTQADIARINQLKADEAAKESAANQAVYATGNSVTRTFYATLRADHDVKQAFDPWQIDLNTGDAKAATTNTLSNGLETLHQTHLHITAKDADLGY